MSQGTGRIVDFTKPVPPEERVARPQLEIQRLSSHDAKPQSVEVRIHETVVVDNDLIRRPGDPEIRVRDADPKAWEDVKKNDD